MQTILYKDSFSRSTDSFFQNLWFESICNADGQAGPCVGINAFPFVIEREFGTQASQNYEDYVASQAKQGND